MGGIAGEEDPVARPALGTHGAERVVGDALQLDVLGGYPVADPVPDVGFVRRMLDGFVGMKHERKPLMVWSYPNDRSGLRGIADLQRRWQPQAAA